MPTPSREKLLSPLQSESLIGLPLSVENSGETRKYTLVSQKGVGKTAVAWKAKDNFDNFVIIKFVLQADYESHSLESEMVKARSVNSPLLAKIVGYGKPGSTDSEIDWDKIYAIAVEWIDGIPFNEYLAKQNAISIQGFRQIVRDFCELLQCLAKQNLIHNDLKSDNILVRQHVDPLTGVQSDRIVAIDTGQLKTQDRRDELVNSWRHELSTLNSLDAHILSLIHI